MPAPPPRKKRAPSSTPSETPAGGNETRAPRSRRPWLIGAVGVIVVVALAVVVLSGGGDSGPAFRASTVVDLKVGTQTLEYTSDKGPIQFPADVSDAVLKGIGTYIDAGIVKALRTGKAADAKLGQVFSPGAMAQLTGAGRGALLDEGLPKAVGKVQVIAAPVASTGLVSDDQKVILATGAIDFKISSRSAQGVVQIERKGELLFAPDATGAWKITSFTMNVSRSGPGVEAPPTSAPPASAPGPSTTTGR